MPVSGCPHCLNISMVDSQSCLNLLNLAFLLVGLVNPWGIMLGWPAEEAWVTELTLEDH